MAKSRSSGTKSRSKSPSKGGRARTAAPRARSGSKGRGSSKSCSMGRSASRGKGKTRTCGSNACEVQVGFDPVSVTIEEGMSVEEAFASAAEDLGLDTDSAVTYKAHGKLISGETLAKPGVLYVCVPAKSGKG